MKVRRNLIVMAWGLFVFCEPIFAQWTVPVAVEEINTDFADEWTPYLSFDGRTLYFSRGRSPDFDYFRIYQATRVEPFGAFTKIREVSELNRSSHLISPWVSPDNLRLYYHKEGSDRWRLKVSERGSVRENWSKGVEIVELNVLGSYLQSPRLTADELTIVFSARDIVGGEGDYDMWMASRQNRNSAFSNVRNLSEINTAFSDKDAFITPDGLTIYFASMRNSKSQIFKASRERIDAAFGNIEHITVFDTRYGSSHPSISSDGMSFYFAKWIGNRPRDIYVSSYIPEPGTVLLLGFGAALLRVKKIT